MNRTSHAGTQEGALPSPILLDSSSLAYKRLGDIQAGNLIYIPLELGELAVGMRVKRLNGEVAEALALRYHARTGEVMPALLTGFGNQHCIDWGMRPTVYWEHPLRQEIPDNTKAAEPGVILLSKDRLLLRTYFGNGRGEAMYFDLRTGTEHEAPNSFATILDWSIGVRSTNSAILRVATYPLESQ